MKMKKKMFFTALALFALCLASWEAVAPAWGNGNIVTLSAPVLIPDSGPAPDSAPVPAPKVKPIPEPKPTPAPAPNVIPEQAPKSDGRS